MCHAHAGGAETRPATKANAARRRGWLMLEDSSRSARRTCPTAASRCKNLAPSQLRISAIWRVDRSRDAARAAPVAVLAHEMRGRGRFARRRVANGASLANVRAHARSPAAAMRASAGCASHRWHYLDLYTCVELRSIES